MTAPLPNARQQVWVSRVLGDDQLLTDAPSHSRCGTLMNTCCSMALSAEHRLKICSPSLVMVTFPCEWKILEWNVNPQTTNQPNWDWLVCVLRRIGKYLKPPNATVHPATDFWTNLLYILSTQQKLSYTFYNMKPRLIQERKTFTLKVLKSRIGKLWKRRKIAHKARSGEDGWFGKTEFLSGLKKLKWCSITKFLAKNVVYDNISWA